jgi:NDP-sugar pyrophosphorylase family protein
MHIEVSREDAGLLDTGGGLKKAAWFFRDDSEPFIVHNVDVISTIDFQRMLQFHLQNQALATIAVQDRKTSRPLMFDERLQLYGRGPGLAFSGIHVISPPLLAMLTEEGPFSIIDSYLRLAAAGERILAFRADEYYWRDLGRPEDLKQAGGFSSGEVKRKAAQKQKMAKPFVFLCLCGLLLLQGALPSKTNVNNWDGP